MGKYWATFEEAKAKIASGGPILTAFNVVKVQTVGPPSWDPHGTYRAVGGGGGVEIQRELDDGTWVPAPLTRALAEREGLGSSPSASQVPAVPEGNPKNVFVIHGRNIPARDAMGDYLSSIGLKAKNFSEIKATPGLPGMANILEIIIAGMKDARAVIALFTPDEFAALRPEFRYDGESTDEHLRWQARQNVIFEAGLAAGRDPHRVLIVRVGPVKLFSDIAGVGYYGINSHEDRLALRLKLKQIGCEPDMETISVERGDFKGSIDKLKPVSPVDAFAEPALTTATTSKQAKTKAGGKKVGAKKEEDPAAAGALTKLRMRIASLTVSEQNLLWHVVRRSRVDPLELVGHAEQKADDAATLYKLGLIDVQPSPSPGRPGILATSLSKYELLHELLEEVQDQYAEQIAASRKSPARPLATDDESAQGMIAHWMINSPSPDVAKPTLYTELDESLGLAPGMAKKHIKHVAEQNNYDCRATEDRFFLKYRKRPIGDTLRFGGNRSF